MDENKIPSNDELERNMSTKTFILVLGRVREIPELIDTFTRKSHAMKNMFTKPKLVDPFL